MLRYTHPGIYSREGSSDVPRIAAAPTSVALFVGPTRGGIDAHPVRLQSFDDFQHAFGGLSRTSNLSYSVLHFFQNGGGEAFVVRVPANAALPARTALQQDGVSAMGLTVTALGSGAAGNHIFLEIDGFGVGGNPFAADPSDAPAHDRRLFNLTVHDRVTGRTERFDDLSTAAGGARYAPSVVNNPATGSRLVSIAVTPGGNGPQMTGTVHRIGAAPAAGAAFAADVCGRLSVERRGADGAPDPTLSVTNLAVTAFAAGSARPASPTELASRLEDALNAAIRADDQASARLAGAGIEAQAVEEGAFLRLRLSAPRPGAAVAGRVHDATVSLGPPASGASLIATYALGAALVSNPSRYQLGQPYVGSQMADAPQAGADGDASGQPGSEVFLAAVAALDGLNPFFNILCLPDLARARAEEPHIALHANAITIYAEAARICARKFAFLLVDPPPDVTDAGRAKAWRLNRFTFQSSHAAAFFPTIRVDDPLEPGAIRTHPPSGAIAGLMARIDAQSGVWSAPAGAKATLAGVHGPSVELTDAEQGLLNPVAVNVIRRFPVHGTVNFGARTVEGSDVLGSEWKYIPIRRTASFILRSLSEALITAVHRPNGPELWAQLRLNATAFMQGLHRQGAFRGVSEREAFFVACGPDTMTPEDIQNGVVNMAVGFAPLRPAEFVIINLSQMLEQSVQDRSEP
jgi:phage tail sheath protein FI